MNKFILAIGAAIGGIAVYAVLTAITAFLVQLFWNNSVVDLFHLPKIGYIQAWFLNMLCVVLFKPGNVSISKKD